MSDKEKILPHNYDGIQELNNPLPGWWLATFYITIVFSIGYYAYYEILDGPTSDQYLEASMENIQKQKIANQPAEPQKESLNFEALIANDQMMAAAKAQYVGKCAACHGQSGEGLIGPNLADAYWLHSKGDMPGIFEAIRTGFLQKGMPGWKDLIPAQEQPYLAAYVKSLQGTNPANPKAPQGEKVQ